jgi:uncharacterized damage-inducible protein DinB
VHATDILVRAYDDIRDRVASTVEGLPDDVLATRPGDRANTIAWLVWHLTRVQDDHVAGVSGTGQVWTEDGWAQRFGLPLDDDDTGYGHSPDDVAKVRASADLLTAYHDAVHAKTVGWLRGLSDADLDRVVDQSWDPPVTLGVRLSSVVGDDLQHVGQAAYARGLLE